MSHTYWDPKGMVKRRPGGHTYHGGNTRLSAQYKERYIPHYNPETTLSNVDRTDKLSVIEQSDKWNTYQKRMWYQDNLDHTTPEFEDFPGIHAEWRHEGEFEKSTRKYNSKFVYDFRVNVTTTDADGIERTEQIRTADHTAVTKLRRDVDEKERFDIQNNRKTVNFQQFQSDPQDDEEVNNRAFSREGSDLSTADIQYFNQKETPRRPQSAPSVTRTNHPAINPGLCRQHPKETFAQKESFPLFWSGTEKQDSRHHRTSSNLLDTTGRTARNEYSAKNRNTKDRTPYNSRPMTSQQFTLRSKGSRNLPTRNPSSTASRRPQSGYERGLSGTLQKNDGWRDDSLLSGAGKISFYPLSFDVLETLSFPRGARATGSVEKKPMSQKRVEIVHKLFIDLAEMSNSSDTASMQVIMSAFSPGSHPAVVSKRVSERDVNDSFILDLYRISQFEIHGSVFNVFDHYSESDVISDVQCGDLNFDVTSTVFLTLYEAYSQGIHNDGFFERLLCQTWQTLGDSKSVSDQKHKMLSYQRRLNSSSLNVLK